MQDTEHKNNIWCTKPITCEYCCGGVCTVLHSAPNHKCPLRREEGESGIKQYFGVFYFIFIFNEALLQYDTRRSVRHVQICQTYKWVFMIKEFKHYLGMQ